MSITATIFDTCAEVRVNSGPRFLDELDELKTAFKQSDRMYDANRMVWIIHDYMNYLHLDFIKMAVENRSKQLSLF